MTDKEKGLIEIQKLVDRFEQQLPAYKKSDYNETQTRTDFIGPFFEALGWDVNNKKDYSESYRGVIHEAKIKIGNTKKTPDYLFRLSSSEPLFFVEAKKPSVFIKEDIIPAFQLRNYAWNSKLSISILTDFEEFSVYDCTKKPLVTDKASVARIEYLTYKDYVNKWDFLWDTFSNEGVLKGGFDKYNLNNVNKKGTSTVDKEFLKSLDEWRTVLAENINKDNKSLNEDELNFIVQHTLDRIIFLRICEDRAIEPYGKLSNCLVGNDFYQNLFKEFKEAEEKYNSGLFDFKKDTLSQKIILNNKIIKKIIDDFYYPDCPYDFSVLSVEILGSAYEQFLGKTITINERGKAVVDLKPEVRKAGGVYYTPQYIVDYIIENTVGELCKNKTPNQIEKIKIVDPACGSGSFLLGAYQFLLTWHKDYYHLHPNKKNPLTPDKNLTTEEKKRILLNNIFGVDIDINAVEVTKLSLLLKCLEGETNASISHQMTMFRQRVLPSLDFNIQIGNSLIDLDIYSNELDFGEERKIRPFSWKKAFPEIFEQGGFDVVVGNPPYVAIKELNKSSLKYFYEHYTTGKGQVDLFSIFIEKGIGLINSKGFISFIVPDSINDRSNFTSLRKIILNETSLQSILTLSNVFKEASVGSSIIVCRKNSPNIIKILKTKDYASFCKNELHLTKIKPDIFLKNENYNFSLINKHIKNIFVKIYENKKLLHDISFIGRGEEIGKKSDYISNKKLINSFFFMTGSDFGRYKTKEIKKFIKKNNVKKNYDKLYFDKIIVRQVGRNITANIDELNCIIPQSVYAVKPNKAYNKKYLLGLLNSMLFDFIYTNKINTKKIFPRILIENLQKLPIKTIDFSNKKEAQAHDQIVKSVEQLLQLNRDLQEATLQTGKDQIQNKIDYHEDKINNLVYQLYDLTEEEINLIK